MGLEPAKSIDVIGSVQNAGTNTVKKKSSEKELISFSEGKSVPEENYPGLGVEKSQDEDSRLDKLAARELKKLDRAIERQERRLEKAERKMEKYGSEKVSAYGYQKMQEELDALISDRDKLVNGENVEEILSKYAPEAMARNERREQQPIKRELNEIDSQIKKKSAELYRTRDYGENSESAKLRAELDDLYIKKSELESKLNNSSDESSEAVKSGKAEDNGSIKKEPRVSTANPKEVSEICDDMFKAIDGIGTDDELFEKTLSRLNKDNIIEVMDQWNKTYGKDYKETFMDSFMNDADKKQQREFGVKIVHMLEQRAKEAGLDFEAKSAYMKMELNQGVALTQRSMINMLGHNISQMFGEIKEKEQGL